MRGEGESHITYSLDKIRLACYNAEERKNGHSAEQKTQADTGKDNILYLFTPIVFPFSSVTLFFKKPQRRLQENNPFYFFC
jgi:hypothetical protein